MSSVPSKTSPVAQNKENETRRPRYRPKMSLGVQNMKTGPNAFGTA
jgi:hypothetical protein